MRFPLNLKYKPHQIPNLKFVSSRLAVVFAQTIETRCSAENEDVVGALLNYTWVINNFIAN